MLTNLRNKILRYRFHDILTRISGVRRDRIEFDATRGNVDFLFSRDNERKKNIDRQKSRQE